MLAAWGSLITSGAGGVQAGRCRKGRPFYHPSVLMLMLSALDLHGVERVLTHLTMELLRACQLVEPDGSFDLSALDDLTPPGTASSASHDDRNLVAADRCDVI